MRPELHLIQPLRSYTYSAPHLARLKKASESPARPAGFVSHTRRVLATNPLGLSLKGGRFKPENAAEATQNMPGVVMFCEKGETW